MPIGGWPSPPDRSPRIAALVGGYRLGAERADELAESVAEVIAGAETVQSEGRPPGSRENHACRLGSRQYGAPAVCNMLAAERTRAFGAVSLLLC